MKTTFAAAVALATMAGAAQAATTVIDTTSYTAAGCLGATSCMVGDATISAKPQPGATLIETTFRGKAGLGVNFNTNAGPGNTLEPEISGDAAGGGTESVEIAYSIGQFISSIEISHLFSTETFDNDPDEEAVITAFGAKGTGVLTITNTDNTVPFGGFTAVGDATVEKIDAFTGTFSITDAFASLGPISKLMFTATSLQGPTVDGKPGTRGDYSISVASTAAVPLPAAAWMLLAGLGGLGYLGRRRARA